MAAIGVVFPVLVAPAPDLSNLIKLKRVFMTGYTVFRQYRILMASLLFCVPIVVSDESQTFAGPND
jgi:hypothetical protein